MGCDIVVKAFVPQLTEVLNDLGTDLEEKHN